MGDALGRNDHGGNLFKWERTSHIYVFEETGLQQRSQEILTEDGRRKTLYAAETTYRRYPWADVIGDRWCIVRWKRWTREQWIAQHGTSWPWPRHGEYEMVSGGCMPKGEVPDERVTAIFIRRVTEQLDLHESTRQHLDKILVGLERQRQDELKPVHDHIDDILPAFAHAPGAKDHVSLPTPQFLQQERT